MISKDDVAAGASPAQRCEYREALASRVAHLQCNPLIGAEELRVERCNELNARDHLSNQDILMTLTEATNVSTIRLTSPIPLRQLSSDWNRRAVITAL